MKINIGNHEFTELWDGFLPVKVKDEVKLANYVHMIVIPSEYKDQIMKVMPEQLSDRAFCLSHDKLMYGSGQKRYIPLCAIWQKVM